MFIFKVIISFILIIYFLLVKFGNFLRNFNLLKDAYHFNQICINSVFSFRHKNHNLICSGHSKLVSSSSRCFGFHSFMPRLVRVPSSFYFILDDQLGVQWYNDLWVVFLYTLCPNVSLLCLTSNTYTTRGLPDIFQFLRNFDYIIPWV